MDCVTPIIWHTQTRPEWSEHFSRVSSLLSRTFLELVFLLLLVLILDPHFHFPALGGLQLATTGIRKILARQHFSQSWLNHCRLHVTAVRCETAVLHLPTKIREEHAVLLQISFSPLFTQIWSGKLGLVKFGPRSHWQCFPSAACKIPI